MLPDSTTKLINDQIAEELRHLNSIFCDTQEDKMDTLERINKLRSMLTPNPSNETPKTETSTTKPSPLLDAIIDRIKKH